MTKRGLTKRPMMFGPHILTPLALLLELAAPAKRG